MLPILKAALTKEKKDFLFRRNFNVTQKRHCFGWTNLKNTKTFFFVIVDLRIAKLLIFCFFIAGLMMSNLKLLFFLRHSGSKVSQTFD